jgi:surface antigen
MGFFAQTPKKVYSMANHLVLTACGPGMADVCGPTDVPERDVAGRKEKNKGATHQEEGLMAMRNQACRGGLVSAILVAFLLMGCESTGPKATVGGLGGAAAGGLLAAALGGKGTGIAAGTILGGLIGSTIGDRLDAADREKARAAASQALESVPSGQSVAWRNSDSGHRGVVTPVWTYQLATGQYCREYTQTITIGGERHQSYGTACRQPEGSWQIVS